VLVPSRCSSRIRSGRSRFTRACSTCHRSTKTRAPRHSGSRTWSSTCSRSQRRAS